MAVTLTVSEICQIILVVIAIASFLRDGFDKHDKKK